MNEVLEIRKITRDSKKSDKALLSITLIVLKVSLS